MHKKLLLAIMGMSAVGLSFAHIPRAQALPPRCVEDAWNHADSFGPRMSEVWVDAAAQYMDENCPDEAPRTPEGEIDLFFICASRPGFCV